MQLTNVLIAPVVTEKSTDAQSQSKYTFRVHPDATKIDIMNAVKAAYGADAKAVNIVPVLKKVRLVGRGKTITKRPAAKKAIVTLSSGQSIDFNKLKSTKK